MRCGEGEEPVDERLDGASVEQFRIEHDAQHRLDVAVALAARPVSSILAWAPSEARSSTITVPMAEACTAFTVSTAPPADSATGSAATAPAVADAAPDATTTEATGISDRAAEASLCAWAALPQTRPAASSAWTASRCTHEGMSLRMTFLL